MTSFHKRTLNELADMICGNDKDGRFPYRSGTYFSEFFDDCGMDQYVHDGSTRKWWVSEVLKKILRQPSDTSTLPGSGVQMVIRVLMDRADGTEEDPERKSALAELNTTLAREGLQAFYCDDSICFLRSTKTGEDSRPDPVVDRALSQEEMERRERLASPSNAGCCNGGRRWAGHHV